MKLKWLILTVLVLLLSQITLKAEEVNNNPQFLQDKYYVEVGKTIELGLRLNSKTRKVRVFISDKENKKGLTLESSNKNKFSFRLGNKSSEKENYYYFNLQALSLGEYDVRAKAGKKDPGKTTVIVGIPSEKKFKSCAELRNCLGNGECVSKVVKNEKLFSCNCNDRFSGDVCGECKKGFFGKTCTSCPVKNNNICNGHGKCRDGLGGDGKCVCSEGYIGELCDKCDLTHLPFNDLCLLCPGPLNNPCNGNGTCNVNNTCTCNGGFSGSACDDCVVNKYGSSCLQCINCGEHGKCRDGIDGDGKCICSDGYAGTLCEKCEVGYVRVNNKCVFCPGSTGNKQCNGNGKCNENGVCICGKGFSGKSCKSCDKEKFGVNCLLCPKTNLGICNGQGTCSGVGECKCNKGFSGKDCGFKICPNNCSGHGKCVDGMCVCESDKFSGEACNQCSPGYAGADCSSPVCKNNCSGRGTCVSPNTCECVFPYTEVDCSVCLQGFVLRGGECIPGTLSPATSDNVAPQLESATVNGSTITLDYNENLSTSPTPATSDFVVRVNSVTNGVVSVSIANGQVTISFSPAAASMDIVDISYTAGGNPIKDSANNNAANLSQQSVTNVTP